MKTENLPLKSDAHFSSMNTTLIILSASALILFLNLYVGQLTNPFISHDDFDWLISPSFGQGFETPWSKASTEGRWLNYPWSLLTMGLSIKGAVYLFVSLSIASSLAISQIYAKRVALLAALVFYVSPASASLSTWPVTQSSSIIILILFSLAIYYIKSALTRNLVVFASVVSCLLTYPAYAPLIFVIYLSFKKLSSIDFIKTISLYIFSYAAGIVIIFSLNYVFHKNFGITVSGWRHPTPLFPNGDFLFNLHRYAQFWVDLLPLWPLAIVSALSYALCLLSKTKPRECINILFGSVLIVGMEASSSIIAGLDLPSRTSLWVWAALVAPILFLAYNNRMRTVGMVFALVPLFMGVTAWINHYSHYSRLFPYAEFIGQTISIAASENQGKYDGIILFGDLKKNRETEWFHSNRHLRNFLYKQFELETRSCAPEECDAIEDNLSSLKIIPPVLIIDKKLIFVINPERGETY
ncbi:hypothetical protein ABE530_05265 [Brucella sp. TWI559]